MAKSKSKPKFSPELLDELLKGQDPKTVLSSAGLFGDLKKALAERMLNAELDHHLSQPEEEASGTTAFLLDSFLHFLHLGKHVL